MESHKNKRCERCNSNFECLVNDIAHCDCQKVTITEDVKQFIRQEYNDCLCISCLLEIQKELSKKIDFNKKEPIHFQ